MFELFTADARTAVVIAQEEARREASPTVEVEHLTVGSLATASAYELLAEHGVDASMVISSLQRSDALEQPRGHIPLSDSTKQALEAALRHAIEFSHPSITAPHVLLGAVTTDLQGGLGAVLEAAGMSTEALRDVVAGMPPVPPDALPSHKLRALLDNTEPDAVIRPGYERQLVDATLKEGDLAEARRLGERFYANGNRTVARALVTAAELAGDINAVITYSPAAMETTDGAPGAVQSSYGFALAHRGQFEEARREMAAARTDEGVDRAALMLEIAEVELLRGDHEAALRHYREVAEADVSEFQLMRNYWLAVGVAVGAREVDEGDRANSAPSIYRIIDDYYSRRFDVALVETELRRANPRKALNRARKIVKQCKAAGFAGVEVNALELQATALAMMGKARSRAVAEEAAALADRLGRSAIAERIRSRAL
jgi:tetratricopeptide (TPR) repeat protein